MQTRLATNQVKIQQAGDEIMARMQQELRSMTGKLEKEWYVGGRVRWDACSIPDPICNQRTSDGLSQTQD